MQHLVQGHSFGGSVQYFKKLSGEKPWHYFYNFPEIGGEVTFVNTGNAKQLGDQISSSFLIKLPLNKYNSSVETKSFKHYLNLGVGLGYSTKIWDLRENTQALVLGSHFNASVILHYEAALWSSSKYQLTLGLRIHHFSNGAFQLPNLGTNNISISTGFRFLENKTNGTAAPEPQSFKEWRTYISAVGGLKEISPPPQEKNTAATRYQFYKKEESIINQLLA
ncbi:MAG: acyloxyacyl hydrolase [Flavobacteriales bacterium]